MHGRWRRSGEGREPTTSNVGPSPVSPQRCSYLLSATQWSACGGCQQSAQKRRDRCTHANSAAFSSSMHRSFDPSVGRQGQAVMDPVLLLPPPKSCSHCWVDGFKLPFFFRPFMTPLCRGSHGPRCLLHAAGRRLCREVVSMMVIVHEWTDTYLPHTVRSTLNVLSHSAGSTLLLFFLRLKLSLA